MARNQSKRAGSVPPTLRHQVGIFLSVFWASCEGFLVFATGYRLVKTSRSSDWEGSRQMVGNPQTPVCGGCS